jgi:predicted ATP-grasp superfamily ATP-dependent carboligase
MVQERIEGEGHGVFLLIWNGTVRAAFAHRRLREKPPWGGVSTLSESVPLGHEILVKSARLLKALGWQGVAMAEFKRDRRDGRSKLMEVNGRFWGSLQLAIDAGVNFPLLLYRLSRGEDPPTQFDYKVGVKSLWLLGDLDHLLIQLGRSYLSGAGGGRKSRWRAIRDFLDIFENWRRLEIERSDDLSPAWFEWRNYVREVL